MPVSGASSALPNRPAVPPPAAPRAGARTCACPVVSATHTTRTAERSGPENARSCTISLIDAPVAAMISASRARPPGRSLIVTVNRQSRPSATRPTSMMRPSADESMLPPASTSTTRLPLSMSSRPARNAASGAAPAPSTTLFSSSIRRRMASAIVASSTVTTRSTTRFTIANGASPSLPTARPSASVCDSATVVGRAVGERRGEARRALRLDADDRHARRLRLDGRADPRDEAAAADRHDDRFDVGRLLEDLEPHRALAGDHVGVVERVDEREAVARGDFAGVRARLGQVGAVQDDVGAELAAVGHLDQRREHRHHDGRGNAEQLRVIGDALRVIAGGRGDHAALALLGRQLQQRVARAALLEAAGALQVVELAVDVRAGELRQRDRLDARRVVDAAGDAFPGGFDVGERDHRSVALERAARSRAWRRRARGGTRP